LRQLRGYVNKGVGDTMLQILIEEAEAGLAELKSKLSH
jgi:hypothetical protein